jgi:hypothetical protein
VDEKLKRKVRTASKEKRDPYIRVNTVKSVSLLWRLLSGVYAERCATIVAAG